LLPSIPDANVPEGIIEPAIEARLRTAETCSPLHLMLVEAVRRRYKQVAMDADKADKLAVRERLEAARRTSEKC
jgi:hypothetical protein